MNTLTTKRSRRRLSGPRLRALRGERTRRHVCEAMGLMTVQELYNWERGDYEPRSDALLALLAYYGATADDVLEPA